MPLEADRFIIRSDYTEQNEIMQQIKNIAKKYKEQIEEENKIDPDILLKFKNLLNNLEYEVYQLQNLFPLQPPNPPLVLVIDDDVFFKYCANITEEYNNLVIFLASKMRYNNLSQLNKNFVNHKFKKSKDVIEYIYDRYNESKDTNSYELGMELLYEILENLQNKEYNVIDINLEDFELDMVVPAPPPPAPPAPAPAPPPAPPAPPAQQNQQLQQQNQQLQQQNQQLQQRIQQVQQQNQQLQQQLKRQLQPLQQQLQQVQQQNQQLQQQLQPLQQQNQQLQPLQQQNQQLQQQNQQLQQQNQQLQPLQQQNQQLKKDNDKLQEENELLSRLIQDMENDNAREDAQDEKDYEEEIERLTEENSEYLDRIQELQERIETLESAPASASAVDPNALTPTEQALAIQKAIFDKFPDDKEKIESFSQSQMRQFMKRNPLTDKEREKALKNAYEEKKSINDFLRAAKTKSKQKK